MPQQQGPRALVERMEHHQVAIYLAAMAAGSLPHRSPGMTVVMYAPRG
ncbi:hypothetical protein [Streptomyces sp. NBC_00576]|nr:hypothetical protein [Streptomyces sp. NBC_00576]WUB72905.1 hypothetical protein OG734_23920 [Streptomyces sp. NBC_00576]